MLPGRTNVAWILNHHPELNFPNDTCLDLGVAMMHVEAVGIEDPTQLVVEDVPCNQGQVAMLGLAPGTYNVALTPMDANGVALVRAPVIIQAAAGTPGADTSVTANIPHTAWTGVYTGTFLFRLSWAGVSCEAAGVETQTLTLVSGGAVVDARTDTGQKLDGTDDEPCRPLSEQFPQFAPEDPDNDPGLPFGPATLHVVGKDETRTVTFDHVFETFVGASKNNPTLTLDVPAPPPPDAGVDAPPDAPADAPADAPPDTP